MVSRNKLFWPCIIAVCLLPPRASGQARGRHVWHTGQLRGIRTIGGEFGSFASGLSGLTPSSGFAGSEVLRSSLLGAGAFQLQRGALDGGVLSGASGLSAAGGMKGQSYGTVRLNLRLPDPGMTAAPRTFSQVETDSLMNVQPYLQAMGHKTTLQAGGSKPVTSFVPSEPNVYQEYMQRGDRAFREGRFVESDDAFELAVTFARYSPEAHLSKVHAKFALGRYNAAAYHLRKGVTYFPELPLARLRVRGFYGRSDQFVAHLERLRKAIDNSSADVHLRLVLAYFRYFDGAEAEAANALRVAYELNRQTRDQATAKETAEAVQTFWDGMVAAGKASGSLAPTTRPTSARPEPSTRPAETEGAPPEPEKADLSGRREAG